MRKVVLFMVLAAVLAAPAIAGGDHTANGCDGCHTPHGGTILTGMSMPLWNGIVSSTNFTLYSSGTFDATDIGQPDGTSDMCLACHDGSLAASDPTGWGKADNMAPGGSLAGSHPVSFTYQDSIDQGDTGLNATTTAVLGGTIADKLLESGKVQCSSCHDVHSSVSDNLKMDNTNGALCTVCHNK